jgi:hypothetical protein
MKECSLRAGIDLVIGIDDVVPKIPCMYFEITRVRNREWCGAARPWCPTRWIKLQNLSRHRITDVGII